MTDRFMKPIPILLAALLLAPPAALHAAEAANPPPTPVRRMAVGFIESNRFVRCCGDPANAEKADKITTK